MSTLALSAAASGRAHAQHSAAVSRAHASRAASIAPTACHARSVSAVLASHRRLGDAAARSRVASWAISHRRKSATSASASTADGPSSRERASDPDYGSHADAVHAFEDDSEDDSYEAFVASWRASLPTMEPNERAEAHRESCAEGRRRANEKRRKRAVEPIDGEVFRPRERIKSQTDFNRVGRFGRNFNGNVVRVQWSPNESVGPDVTCTRLGIKAPKKHIKRAVDRNLVKRRVRDVFRKNKSRWPKRADVVVYCSAATLAAPYAELEREMLYWGREVVPRVAERDAEKSAAAAARSERRGRNGEKGSRAPRRTAGGDEDRAPPARGGDASESAVRSESTGAVATAEE